MFDHIDKKDFCVVVALRLPQAMWLADMVIAFPVNSSQLRLIRLARLLRLVRLVRVVRGFDSLVVMTTALQESDI